MSTKDEIIRMINKIEDEDLLKFLLQLIQETKDYYS